MISDEFLDYIKKVENGGKAGWDEDQGLWFPHPSPEGGNDTIGYGHKLLDDEVALADAGLEDARILEMLFQDLEKAERVADKCCVFLLRWMNMKNSLITVNVC